MSSTCRQLVSFVQMTSYLNLRFFLPYDMPLVKYAGPKRIVFNSCCLLIKNAKWIYEMNLDNLIIWCCFLHYQEEFFYVIFRWTHSSSVYWKPQNLAAWKENIITGAVYLQAFISLITVVWATDWSLCPYITYILNRRITKV